MKIRVIILFTAIIFSTGCSFTHKNKSLEKPSAPEQEAIQNKSELLPLVLEINSEKIIAALSRLGPSKINSSWGNDENLLSNLIKIGSKEKLKVFTENGLSIYLPHELSNHLNDDVKARFRKELGSATTPDYNKNILDIKNDAFNFLEEEHNKNMNAVYVLLKKGHTVEAKITTLGLNIPCNLISESMIIQHQLDSEAPKFSVITSFLSDLSCYSKDLSTEQAITLWKFEVQRQFLKEFTDSNVLAYLFRSHRSLPYLLPIGRSDILVSIRSLYEVAKVCSFFTEERAKSGEVSCHENPLESFVDETLDRPLYHIVPNSRFERYNALDKNGSVRVGDIESQLFLDEIGILPSGSCDLLETKDGEVKRCESPLSISSSDSDSESKLNDYKNQLPRSIYRVMYGLSYIE